ncbi:MAG TPA: PIN domain-containing protein [Planctomycetota bacterium]|nr:PIN domain-containing protein [Planctomycetota bacterium]
MRVFLDANVVFSASQPESAFARLVAATRRHASVLTSDIACVEARRNLVLKRPDWLGAFEALVEEIEVVPSAMFPLPVTVDEKDVPLLCAAIRARSDYFVTGDRRDFGHLFETRVHGVLVITPLRLAEILAGRTAAEEDEG